MKRRDFGLLAGTSLATTAFARPVLAQSVTPDPALLTTTLTPLGAERAGNADGSIPAWTGGVVSPPLPPGQPVIVPIFADEQPLYTVDASNMAQYAHMLNEGTQLLMSKYGFKMNVYQTHRTAAAPQYVYDNTAKNAAAAQFAPEGGRFGFTGAFAGPPFPIINTADPMVGGVQLIWNHLTSYGGYSTYETFTGGFVVSGGKPLLTFGGSSRFVCPYYDPEGSAETYEGYYSKDLEYFSAPATSNGQQALIWSSSNVLKNPDIVWGVINGEARVRKAPNEAYDTPTPTSNGLVNYDDASGFGGSPQKYDWKVIGKREMLTPYNCNAIWLSNMHDLAQPNAVNPDIVRWEKHRVWVLEATLHPGELNTGARRRLYLDEDTWLCLLADVYDGQERLVKASHIYNICIPSAPRTSELGFAAWNALTGDYAFIGNTNVPPSYISEEYIAPQSPKYFEPQEMAANTSF